MASPVPAPLYIIPILTLTALFGCGDSTAGNTPGATATPNTPGTQTPTQATAPTPTPAVPPPLTLCPDPDVSASSTLPPDFDPFDPVNDRGNIHIYLSLNPGDMDTSVDNPEPSETVPSITYKGCVVTVIDASTCQSQTFSDAECRYKGNTTFDKPKRQYKVKLDKENRLLDYRRFNLHSEWKDATLMREKLVYDLFDEMGVIAPRANHALLFLNDNRTAVNYTYQGLYTLVEQVDKPFLRARFGSENDEGNLYKAYYGYKGRDRGFGDLRVVGLGDDSDYRGGNGWADTYDGDARAYRLKTNESEFMEDYSDLAILIDAINGRGDAPALEAIFDVDGYLRWLAVNSLIGAWDNYWLNAQNYYLYNINNQGQWAWIPWDHDNSLGNNFQDHNGFKVESEDIYYGGFDQNALTKVILENDAHRARYESLLVELLAGPFNLMALSPRIDELKAHLEAPAYYDPKKQYPMSLWYGNQEDVIVTYSDEDGEFGNKAHHLGLRDYIQARTESVQGQLP